MKYKRLVIEIAAIAFFALALSDPKTISSLTLQYLLYFGKSIFPSLFISLCLCSFLVHSPLLSYIYRIPFGIEITLLIMGIFGGFPVGAKCALQLYEDGVVSKKRAEYLCSYSNLCSVSFLTGVVGLNLHGNVSYGIRIVLAQAAASLLIMAVFYRVLKPDCGGVCCFPAQSSKTLTQDIASSTFTILTVGGMIIFFGVVGEFLFHLLPIPNALSPFLNGLIEFSSGCRAAADLPALQGMVCTAFSVGCSGICVAAQISSVLEGKLSMKPYIASKVVSSVLLPAIFMITG